MQFKTERKYSGNVLLSKTFAEEYIDKLDKNTIKIYLIVLGLACDETIISFDDLAANSGLAIDEFLLALSVLQKEQLIKLKGETVTVLDISNIEEIRDDVEFYSPEDVDRIDNNEFSLIRNATEKAFSKLLSHKDVNRLVEMFNWINIPVEVAVLIVEYAASQGKKSLSYVEKIAVDWSEKGIDTAEKAHDYISMLEAVNGLVLKIKRHFMAYDKVLSKKDREYITKWQALHTDDEILDALEITVNATEKLKFSYTDQVLANKYEKSPEVEIKKVRKGKINNFTQEATDYDDFEKRAMEKLLARHKKEE